MAINWFPGHMRTARREVEDAIGKVDVVIEILDARVPHASTNPFVETVRARHHRPALKLLNKADLADPVRTRAWLARLNAAPDAKAVALSMKHPGEVGRIPEYCRALAPQRGTLLKPLRMMALGIPNVGKSTLMNALVKRRIAKVGDEPAITKTHSRHELGPGLVLIDTPGMTWPGMAHETGVRLAATNGIGRNAYDEVEVATWLGAYLLREYRPLLAARYKDPPAACDGPALLEWIARARGLVLRGGVPDLEKAATTLLQDFRGGAIGRISLDAPDAPATP